MAVSLKFLSRTVNHSQQVVAHSPKKAGQIFLGEVSPTKAKTPLGSPSRSAKTPKGSSARMALFFEDVCSKEYEHVVKKTAEVTVSPMKPLVDGHNLRLAAAQHRAAASTAAQQELATSALPAAELARQHFLTRKGGAGPDAAATVPALGGILGGGYPSIGRGGGTHSSQGEMHAAPAGGTGLVSLLGRGEDAANVLPAHAVTVPPELPVLLGHNTTMATRCVHPDAESEKETAERVRQAFMERQGRITGRGAAKKVP